MIKSLPADKLIKVNMTEDRFWELVALAKWPCDCEKAKIMYRKMLDFAECAEFRKMTDVAYCVLDNKIGDRNPAGGGDDSHSDFINHIIGLGREQFYKYANDYSMMVALGKTNGYQESFSYCIPYDSDYKKDCVYSVSYNKTTANRALEEIETFKKMDPDEKFLTPILGHLNLLECIFKTFLKDVDVDSDKAIAELLKEEVWVTKHCKAIRKFFEANYMELPRKFTENGHNGLCTHLFENTINNAKLLVEYLR